MTVPKRGSTYRWQISTRKKGLNSKVMRMPEHSSENFRKRWKKWTAEHLNHTESNCTTLVPLFLCFNNTKNLIFLKIGFVLSWEFRRPTLLAVEISPPQIKWSDHLISLICVDFSLVLRECASKRAISYLKPLLLPTPGSIYVSPRNANDVIRHCQPSTRNLRFVSYK